MSGTESLESALGAAFGEAPATPEAPKAPAQAPKAAAAPAADAPQAEAPEEAPLDLPEEDPADLLAGEDPPAEEAEPAAEPEMELELPTGEKITGRERIKELAERGLKAGRGFEENARVREVLQAHVQQQQMSQFFQQAVTGDIAQIQALEHALQPYERVDWQKEFDTDPFNAMKLKEQRDQLREQRAAAINGLGAKQQQFTAQFQQNAQRVLAAEGEALLAKVPAWRNAEKATQEKGEIASALKTHYGFTPAEVGALTDHRMLLVARDAAAYRKLLANKDQRVKQAREAPATAKPGAAAAQPNGRVEFNKVRGKIKELGTKGNHKAQEELATKLFDRAFK